MAKVKKTIEITTCDLCGKENNWCDACQGCRKDVCAMCSTRITVYMIGGQMDLTRCLACAEGVKSGLLGYGFAPFDIPMQAASARADGFSGLGEGIKCPN